MTIRRYLGTASIAATLALGITGSAFAADVTLNTTGPDSNQSVVIDNSSQVTVTNKNVLDVTNANTQQATTGNVDANNNTSVGGSLQSGNAKNSNATETAITVSNGSVSTVPGAGNGNGGNGSGGSGGNGSVGGRGGSGGNVLGAATVGGFGGGAVLPKVGASFPVDVSALRAAWHPQTNAPTAALANGSRMFTAAMLITATLLSLLGALGSAFYARRRQERV